MIDIIMFNPVRSFARDDVDLHRTFGQAEPFKLGFLIVTIDSNEIGSGGEVAAAVKAFSTFDENFDFGRNDGNMIGGQIAIRLAEAACLAGDARPCDGRVNINDLNDVRNNLGAAGPADGTVTGDTFPFDGVVNIDDINNVRNNFGTVTTPVPEPAAQFLLAFAAAGFTFSRRRMSNRSRTCNA